MNDCIQGIQGIVCSETPFSLTETGIVYKNGCELLKLAEWQTIHDRIHLTKALNKAYQTGYEEGWNKRKQ